MCPVDIEQGATVRRLEGLQSADVCGPGSAALHALLDDAKKYRAAAGEDVSTDISAVSFSLNQPQITNFIRHGLRVSTAPRLLRALRRLKTLRAQHGTIANHQQRRNMVSLPVVYCTLLIQL